jgi:adenylate cyclase
MLARTDPKDNTAVAQEKKLFQRRFLALQESYERKIRELSIIKELGAALRSGMIIDQADFWEKQLTIVMKYRPLAGLGLILENDNSHKFERKAWIGGVHQDHLPPGIMESVQNRVLKDKRSLVIKDLEEESGLAVPGQSLLGVPIIHNNVVIGILSMVSAAKDDFDQNQIRFFALVADHFSTARILSRMYRQMLKEEKQRFLLSRFFSKTVSDQIIGSKGILRLGGDRMNLSVLFADLKGFTSMSEGLEPEQVVAILNRYFSVMIPIIFDNGGTLDKVLGDGLLAVFGAPIVQQEHALHVVTAAIGMIHRLEEFNRVNVDSNLPKLSVSIGINAGDAIAGYIGSEDHLNYTVIGDTVNVAQRIESLAGPNEILISRTVYDEIKDQTDKITHLDRIVPRPARKVKGKEKAVELFRVECLHSG